MWRLLLASCTLLSVVYQISGVQYCPNSEFQIWKGYCYAFTVNAHTTWNSARTRCQQKSTSQIKVDLASITSPEEQKYIYDIMYAKTGYDYWIGLTDKNVGVNDFYWVDGEDSKYRNWALGEPNNSGGKEDCTEVSRYSNGGQWNDMACDGYYQAYVCKGEAYSGWAKKGDMEYFIDAGSGDESLDWYRAREWCNENGGELASITSDAETNSIYELIKLMGFKNNLWIGLNRLKDDQTKWTWSDGTAYGSYDNWEDRYPKEDSLYRHHCGTMKSDDTTGKWRNTNCGSLDHGFVCKRDPNDIGVKTTPAPVTGGGYCPRGYHEAGDKCFRLHTRTPENGHTWLEAINYCRSLTHYRHDIATISNPLEQAVINSALQKSSLPLWMGLYRTGSGNAEWLWTDNAQFMYTNWGFGEPISSTAKCAGVRPFSIPIGSWGNQDCETRQGFICQTFKNPSSWISTPPMTTPNSCKGDYEPYWKGCYKLYTTLVTWDAANTQCMADGGNLVSINHGAEDGYIQSLANKDVQKTLWIGLRDTGRTGEYKWSDGWAVLYTKWGDDEPSQDPNTGGCVQLRPVDGTWEDTDCAKQNGFVCKITDEPKVTAPPPHHGRCPSLTGWREHGSYCYKFHQIYSATWSEAAVACKKDSVLANLASIHHLEENNWIYKQLADTGLSTHMWIGMFRRTDTKSFAWNDLSTVQYEHWAPLEPNGEFLGENCVGFHKNYPEMWLDQKCDTSQGYICKAPKEVYPTLPPDGPGFCPPNWVNISNHCYLFQPNLHLEWIDARKYCNGAVSTGAADLVTIKDIAEDIFVNAEMFSREDSIGENLQFWIGLAKKKKGADYIWVDGTSTEGYKHWDNGEPSGKDDGSTNCAFQYILNAQWDDADCNEYKGFACKMPKLSDTSTLTPNPSTSTPGVKTTVREQAPGGSGPSGGAVAGIVIGTLMGVALLGGLIFFLFKNNINPVSKAKDFASGFSNPFYSSTEDTKPVTDSKSDTFA